jgi:hypothetical protein
MGKDEIYQLNTATFSPCLGSHLHHLHVNSSIFISTEKICLYHLSWNKRPLPDLIPVGTNNKNHKEPT